MMPPDDVLVRKELTELLDDFCAGFGVSVTLSTRDGRVLLTRPNGSPTPFCQRIRDSLYGPGPCTAQLRRMSHLAVERRGPVFYTCHAGLRRGVFPVVAAGAVVAVATVSGFRFADEPSASALRDWEERVGPAAALLNDFMALPRYPAEMEKRMARLFSVIADHATSKKLIESRHPSVFEAIVDYVRRHIRRPRITVDEVAAHVGKSASSVSHIVKKEAGISFKRFVIEQRLQAAEELLAEDTTRSIGEVADSLGFSDQFYFSRIYKKYRGFPPKEYVRRSMG
ncbi:MAG TPA: PocR ligand-binding domain-containing protein [Spirochaetia bacterium]